MSYLVQNIISLLSVRIKKDHRFFIRASRVFFILLLLSSGWNAKAQSVTFTSLISTPANSCLNQPVTLTATVDQSLATGNVRFLEGAAVLGIATLDASGIATITLSDLSAGEHTIVAEYEGAAPYDGSTSVEIIHIVNTPPAITTQPSPQIVFSGCSATFSVIAEGSEPLFYQWSRNGVNIANPNSSTLTINNITAAQAGNYSVVITNLCGTITSTSASLSITSLPTASITYGASQFCSSITTPRPVTRTGAAGGIYSSIPLGLDVDPITGDIIPANSTPGTYSVTYSAVSPNGCTTIIASRTITIAQSPTVLISSDFCAGGGSVRLTANVTPQPVTYLWSNGSTASSILVDRAGPYSLTATSPNGCSATLFTNVAQELVYNGDFSAGNVGFTSAYGNNQAPYTGGSTGLWPETLYAVDWNANIHHSNFFGTDHTTGNGNFMIVNGAGHDTTTVWRQSFAVQPNTTYYFSAWAMSLNRVSPYAQLKFTVNDSLFGTTAVLAPGANSNAGPFNWARFFGTWNSGSSTFITISIVDLQIAAGGNDFGLDDISFGTLSPFPFAAAPTGSACEGQTLILRSNVTGGSSPYFYSWTGPNGFTSNAKDPVILNSTMAHASTYTLTVTDAYSCPVTASTVVSISQAAIVNAGPNQGVCAGSSITLAGTRGGSATSSTWSAPSGTFSNTSSLTPTYTPSITNGTVTLTLTSNDPSGICPAAVSTMTVTVGNATANAGSPRNVCAGRTVNLAATIGGGATSASWSAPSGTFSNVNSLNAIYTPSITTGSVTLTLTTNDPPGPCGPATSNVIITVRPVSTSTETVIKCEGALPYTWNNITLTAAGTYTATLQNSFGCDSIVTLTLKVNPNSTSTQNITICQNALPYSWNNRTLTAAGTYSAELANMYDCDSTVILNLTVNPNSTSTQNITICQNALPYSWNNRTLTAAGTYSAELANMYDCDSTVILNLTVNPNSISTQNITICQNSLPYNWNNQSLTTAGTYTTLLQNNNGCDSTVTLILTVNPNVTSTQDITICQNALPYSWNNQSLTAAGTYTALLQNINGCDSTVTLILTVNPNVTSTQNITICQNALPYSWNNQSLTAAGTYTALLQNINGCDSTVVLDLTVNPNVTSTQNITICQNSLPYNWNNLSLTAAGTYTALLQNINGCDSTVTLNLTVNPNVTSTQNITICQNSLPYNWNNLSLTTAGTYTALLQNINGCDSTVVLDLTVNPNVTSTQNITICQNSLPYNWNNLSLTAAGTYTALLQNINGCDSTVTLNLTVNPNVTSTQNITICQNSLPYNWNNLSLTTAGTYTALLQNINGCDSTVVLDLTVNPNVTSTQNITICQNSLPYNWNNLSLTAAGTYTALLQNINGCDSTVTLTLIVNPNVTSTQTITICQGALPYNWNSQSLTAAGTYQATLTNVNGCDSTVTLTLNVNPNVISTQNITICEGSLPFSWNSQSLTAAGTYQATLTNANGCDSTVTLTLNVNRNVTSTQIITICQGALSYSWNTQSLTAAGTYQATLQNVNGCDSTVTLTLNVNPNVTSTQIISICQGALPYSWNSQSLTAAGTYQATLQNVNGCDSTVTLTLNVNPNVTSTQTITICQGALPYNWISQSLTAAGTYQATLTNANGCDSTVTLTLNVNPNVTSTQIITICQGALPFSWNSQSLTAAGTYQATLTNANGCDSTVTLTLNVNRNVTSTQIITICQGALPFSWNSQSLTAAGTYQGTLQNENGCDSTVTLTLNVNPNVISTQNITICENALPYSWNRQSLTAAGIYQATLQNVNGCDSTATLTLNVNPNVISTQNITICEGSLPLSWNSQSLTAAGSYQATLQKVNGCDSTVTLTLNVNPNVTSTQNTTICDGALPYSWNSQSLTAAGTYQATLPNVNGCDSTITLTLNVNPNVTSTQTITICQGALPYSWNSQSLTAAGNYQATLTNVNNCDSTVTLTLNVNPNVTNTQTITICQGALPYSWNTQSLTAAGTYQSTLQNVNGCDSTVTLTLNVNPNITSTQNITICEGALPYSWNSQSLTAAGTYQATLQNVNGCDSTVTLTLNVNPNVTSTQTITICQDALPYGWNSQSLTAAGTYQATLPNVNGCDSTVTLTLNVNPNVTSTLNITICEAALPFSWNSQSLTAAGSYQATLQNVNGCDSTAILTLNVNQNVTATENITICEGQLPFTWNGQTLTTTGTRTTVLNNINGCDSTVTLNLSVNPIVTGSETITICEGQLPFTWNGQTLIAAGTTTANLLNIVGCDSIATLYLIVNPNVTSTLNITICEGALPFSWNSQFLTAPGTYQGTLQNENGCDSTVTLTLNVNPNVISTQNITICENALPYSWNRQSLTAAGIYQATLQKVNGCDSTVTLTLNVNPNVISTQNITICEGSLPLSWNSQSLTAAGSYQATLQKVNGCDSTVTLTLNVNPNVTSTQNTTICDGALPYSWNSQSLTAAGTYQATLPNVNGCDSTITLTLNVNPNVTSTQTITICQGALPYSWNSQSLTAAGNYQATLTNVNNCDSTVTLTLNVNPNVTNTQTITICQGALPYSWNTQSLTAAGTYQSTLQNVNGCDSTVTLTLNVNPNITSTQNITICEGALPYSWNSQSLTAAGTYQATLQNVNGCDSTVTITLNVNPNVISTQNITICEGSLPLSWNNQSLTTAGSYQATLQNVNGCDSTVTLTLNVNPNITSTQNITICEGALPYSWNSQSLTAAGTYQATLQNVNGCDSTVTLTLNVNPKLTSTQTITICQDALPYGWNSQSLTAAGTYQATLPNVNGCDSTVTLRLNVNPNVISTQTITICQGALPFSWDSQSLTAAGTYQATLQNINGCDSTVILTLNVNQNVTATENITICEGQLPFTWNGQTLTTAGTRTTVLNNINGCDSTVTLNLSINPIVTGSETITICEGQLPFTWNGQTLIAAGTTTANLLNIVGCDSIATLYLIVNPNVTSTLNITICEGALPFSWNSQFLTAAGIYQATLQNVNGCDSTVTLTLNINPNVTSTQTITICEGALPYNWNSQSLIAAGTYQATLTNVNGCDSTVTLTLNVNPNVTSTQIITICQGALPYSWNTQSLTAAGTYQSTLQNVNGCDSTVTLTLNVNPNVTSTQTITICQGALPYSWNSQSLTAAGIYQATLQNVNGCDSTIILTLNVNQNVTATENITICEGQLPFTWNGQTLTTTGTRTTVLNNINGCDSTVTLNLSVNPIVTGSETITICEGQLPFTWNGQTLIAAGTTTANLLNIVGCDSIATLYLIINPNVTSTLNITICESALPFSWNSQSLTAAGTYQGTLQNENGCDSTITLTLNINPNVTSTQTITICEGALPYHWNSQSLTAAGTYQTTLQNVNGCDSTVTLTLNVNPNVTSSQTITICEGVLPYSWNSQSLTASGAYQATLQNVNGCDSTVTLTLIVNPKVTGYETITICEGLLPYSWNGQTLTTAGTATSVLTSTKGCDSTTTLTLLVNPNVTGSQMITICEASLPYSWNDQTITAAGDYTAALVSAAGCDSTATLHLLINPVVTGEQTITICEGQLPYSWNGQLLMAAGTTTALLQNIKGCDSLATLTLIVNPNVTGLETITICEGQLPYSWNGQILTAAGSATAALQNINGCDSLVTLALVVNPNVISQETITICEGQLPYSWNGQNLTDAGTATATLQNMNGCDSLATLILIVNPNVTGQQTITICEGQLPYSWNGQNLTAAGTATAALQNMNGCDSLVTLTLIVNPNVSGLETITICEGQLPYTWNGQTLTAAGTATALLTSITGCDSTATLTLIVNPNVTGSQIVTICEASLPYSWNNQSITAAGDYTAILVSAAGCDSIATLHLVINPVVTGEQTITICEGQLPYTWNGQTLMTAGTATAALQNIKGCDSLATLTLIVNPIVTGQETITICEGQLPYIWNGQSLTEAGTTTSVLTSVAGCDSTAILILIVNPIVTGEETITICVTALPYKWNNQSIAAAGDYTAIIASAAGCDSIATLHLIINPVVAGEETITICETALPYNWNNQAVSAAGDYTAILISSTGCDSVATLHLIVNPIVTSQEAVSLCEAALPYSWNNQSITVAGDYTTNFASATGCDSIATLHLTVTPQPPAPIVAVSPAICSTLNGMITVTSPAPGNATTYSINGLDFQVSNIFTALALGSYVITVKDVNGCTSSINVTVEQVFNTFTIDQTVTNISCTSMNGSIDVTTSGGTAPYTYGWTGPNNFSSTNEDLHGLAAGDYTVIVTDANGCTQTRTITVGQSISTITLNHSVVNTICTTSNGSVNLTANNGTAPYNYAWTGLNNFSSTNEDLNGLAPGEYTVTVTDANGCTAASAIKVNQVTTIITLTEVVTNATCNAKDGSINLIVNGGTAPYTYSWTGPFSYIAATKDLSSLAPGTYTVAVKDENGCTSVTTAIVGQTGMTPTVATHDIHSCSTADLTAPSVTAGSDQGLALSYWQDSASTNPVADPASVSAGTYYIKGTNTYGCSSTKPVIVTIEATPLFIIAHPAMKCESETVDLTDPAITAGSDPRLTFTYWNDADATSPIPNPQAISKSGTYYIKAQAVGGCTFVKSVEVVVALLRGNKSVRYPTVNASPNFPVQLNAREPGLSNKYTWNPPTGLNTSDRKDPEFRYDQNMEYTVRIEYDNQCPVVDTVLILMRQITTNCTSDIFVPKAWSPNNDRHNDKLFPIPVCMRELKYFRVFNRWGQLVFETNVLELGWDGIFNGQPQVMDTYTWTLEATGEDGKHFKRAGNSVLVR